MRTPLMALLLAALTACGHPQTLTYDYGRSFEEAFSTQADLTRPSVQGLAYPLSGVEGIALRQRVQEETTDEESGRAEKTAKTEIQ